MQPIWKDYYVNLGSYDSINFMILCDGEKVYSGRAFKKPGEQTISIRINDICADYMLNVLPRMTAQSFDAIGYPAFEIKISENGDTWENVDQVEFYNDWSYDYAHDPARNGLAFPVNGKIARSQWLTYSAFKASSIRADIKLKDGSSTFVIIPVEISADFNSDFNSDFAISVRPALSGTAVFKLDKFDAESVKINGTTYQVVDDCNRFILYYCNEHGGWDSLLIDANHAESDELSRMMRDVAYDNRNISNRGRGNYMNEVTKVMTLNTSWLTGDQPSRMHHLLNAIDVYLYDSHADAMIPVLLTNTTTEYKTYKGNGGQLVNYAIEVEFANRRIRR